MDRRQRLGLVDQQDVQLLRRGRAEREARKRKTSSAWSAAQSAANSSANRGSG